MEGFRVYGKKITVDFEPELNVFSGTNEAGKSSLLKGIKSSLYPPSRTIDRQGCITEGSEVCTLELEYEIVDGKRFKVERDLVENKHSISELEAQEWNVLASSPTEVARYIVEHTGCDEQLFVRTLMVGHEGIEVPADDGLARVLGQRLETLLGGGGPVSAVKATQKLDETHKKLVGPQKGEIVVLERQLGEIRSLYQRAAEKSQEMEDKTSQLKEMRVKTIGIRNEQAQIAASMERGSGYETLAKKKEELELEKQTIDAAMDARQKLSEIELEVNELERSRPSGHPPFWIGWIVGMSLLGTIMLTGLLLSNHLPPSQIKNSVIGVIGLSIIFLISVSIQTFFKDRFKDKTTGKLMQELAKKYAEAKGRAEALMLNRNVETIPVDRSRITRDLEELSRRIIAEAAFNPSALDMQRYEFKSRELVNLVSETERGVITLEMELQSLASESSVAAELEDEVMVLSKKHLRLTNRALSLDMAKTKLAEAIEDIRQGVGPSIAEQATLNLQKVVPDYRIGLEEGPGLAFVPTKVDGTPFGNRELSDGTIDQFHFALRIALSDSLLKEVNPPIFLDDPFRYSDESRNVSLNQLISEIAKKRQVFYFTVSTPKKLKITHQMPLWMAQP